MRFRGLAVRLIVLFLMGGTGLLLKAGVARGAEKEIRLGILPIVDALPYIIISDKGLDRKHGFRFSTFPFQSALERDAALTSGSADGALSDMITAIVMVSRNIDVAVAALLLGAVGKEGPFYILGSPKGGPATLNALKGAPIGISSNTIIEYVTDRMLQSRGFGPDDIKTVEVKKIPLRFQMLMTGQIGAATLPDPLATLAIAKGAKHLANDVADNLSQSITMFTGRAIRTKTATMKAYARAYNDAVDAINADPDSWKGLLVKKARLPEPILNSYSVVPFPRIQLPSREKAEDVIRWAKGKKLLKDPVTYEKLTTKVLLD